MVLAGVVLKGPSLEVPVTKPSTVGGKYIPMDIRKRKGRATSTGSWWWTNGNKGHRRGELVFFSDGAGGVCWEVRGIAGGGVGIVVVGETVAAAGQVSGYYPRKQDDQDVTRCNLRGTDCYRPPQGCWTK